MRVVARHSHGGSLLRGSGLLPVLMLMLLWPWTASVADAPIAGANSGRIAIVLGETDSYLSAATQYWESRWSPEEVVTGVGSLAELREILASHPARGAQPWGEVIVVSHASEWAGLSVPLYPGIEPATPAELAHAHASGTFPSLRSAILDEHSIIQLDGCGIGRRADILEALSTLLAEAPVTLSASSQLLAYFQHEGGPMQREELLYASRLLSAPSQRAELAEQLRAELANQGVDHAQLREQLWPVKVTLPLPEGPHSRQRAQRIAARLPAVSARLAELGMRREQLQWRIDTASRELIGEAAVLVISEDRLGLIPET